MNRKPGTYTAQDVAEKLQMPVLEVYRAGKARQIPGRIRIGNRTRFLTEVIDRWLTDGTKEVA